MTPIEQKRRLRWFVVTKWYLYVFRFAFAGAAILAFVGYTVPKDQPRYLLAAIMGVIAAGCFWGAGACAREEKKIRQHLGN